MWRQRWVRAHSKPAHSLRLPALLLNEIKKDTPGKFRAMGMKRSGAAINVVVALAAGRERKFTQTERVGSQQLKKLFAKR